MRLRSRTMLVVAGAALAIGAGAGGALAAGGGGGGPETATAATNGEPGIAIAVDRAGPGGPPAAIADYLGLTADELRAQLEGGKTLAQVASARGKSISGLEGVIYADAKSNLDQAVANGKLSANKEQAMLAELKSRVDEIANSSGPRVVAKGVSGGPFGDAVASYLGLTPAELRAQVGDGTTLAQVAADQGKSVNGLKGAIVAGAETDLDAAVAAGKITAAQEQKMLADLESNIDQLVNSAGPVQKTVAP
jgi:AraC-like DNA-binding protein